MDINELKKHVTMQIDELSGLADVDSQHIQKFRALRKELMEEQNFFLTDCGKTSIKQNPSLKPYRDFVTDLSFEKGQITSKNYYANLGNLKSSYKTYLR